MGVREIVPGVHRLGSHLVNWYLVEDEGGLTAVDAGLPAFEKTLDADLQALGHTRADVAAVVLTHSDSDHTSLAPALRAAGARVLIHAGDEATLAEPKAKTGDAAPRHLLPYLARPGFWRFFGGTMRVGGAKAPQIAGAETFADGDVLDVPGRPRAIHTPGHTAGHCAILFERHGALFVGDALYMWNPITGSRSPQIGPSAFNESNETALASLAAIESVEAEVLLPGHGEPWRGRPADAVAQARATGRTA
jgi:glyoxylase-like metal-dependent hydrolase (beta-lactamase superfamily II)